jgi:methionyl-tRNA formyltransferase
MRIIFLATSEFAIPTLYKLIDNDKNIVGIITQPDRRAGRGRKLCCPPIKTVGLDHDIPVLQYHNINKGNAVEEIQELAPDLMVVVSYGQILRQKILDLPPKGIFNVHASLLPKYRGAAPINWAIIRGETETGITTFFLDKGMDTGDIILQRKVAIKPDEMACDLHDRLSVIGADVALETVELIEKGDAPRIPQNDDEATSAPLLSRENGDIDWCQSARDTYNFIRGMNSWPMAFSTLNDERVRIFKSHIVDEGSEGNVGEIVVANPAKGLYVQTGKGIIGLDIVQPQNSKIMRTKDFLNGREIQEGDTFVRSCSS